MHQTNVLVLFSCKLQDGVPQELGAVIYLYLVVNMQGNLEDAFLFSVTHGIFFSFNAELDLL